MLSVFLCLLAQATCFSVDFFFFSFLALVRTKKKRKKEKTILYWELVAHACNHSYSGGRYQEDLGWKPA
jgi:hypothetical protein